MKFPETPVEVVGAAFFVAVATASLAVLLLIIYIKLTDKK